MSGLADILRLFCRSVPPQWDEFGRLRQFGHHTIDGTESLADRFGQGIWNTLKGKTVLDYGCGNGADVLDCIQHGIKAIGIEVRQSVVETARQNASTAGVDAEFRNVNDCSDLQGAFDYVISVNCFEHYMDPIAVLRHMRWFMKPDAVALIYFSPPWLHPYGAHLRTVTSLPWVHLIFPESTVMEVRGDYYDDKPTSYAEASGGGLNRMTIRTFTRLVGKSPLSLRAIDLIPIKGLRPLTSVPGIREFFTSAICAELVPRTQ